MKELDHNHRRISKGDMVEIFGGAAPVRCKVGINKHGYIIYAPWLPAGENELNLRHYTRVPICRVKLLKED